MAQRTIDPDAVQRELVNLQRTPPTSPEHESATRSLVRFAKVSKEDDNEHAVRATEEWVRLYIALRRAGGTGVTRLNAETLSAWHTRVCRQISVKRKCFMIPKADLNKLAEYPPDLDRFVIPEGSLDLPADIYERDVLIVDDGFDRSKLNIPGVMHVEVACKCTQEYPSSGRGREGQLSLPAAPAAASFRQPIADAPASSGSVQDRRDQRGLKRWVSDGSVDSEREPEPAMEQIIQNTVKAMGSQRWSAADTSQPNTVEFWVRIFTASVTQKPVGQCPLTMAQPAYVKNLTRELFQSPTGFNDLPTFCPHFAALHQWSPDAVPTLAHVLMKLQSIDVKADAQVDSLHSWLQTACNLQQMQMVYNSKLYLGFLTHRLNTRLQIARANPEKRSSYLPMLLESFEEHQLDEKAEVQLVATLENVEIPRVDKVRLITKTPDMALLRSQLQKWVGIRDTWLPYLFFHSDSSCRLGDMHTAKTLITLMNSMHDDGIGEVPCVLWRGLYKEAAQVTATSNADLALVFEEQVAARAGVGNTLSPVPGKEFDFSDCGRAAKDLYKQWMTAVKKDTSKHPYLQKMGEIFVSEEAAQGKRRRGIGGGVTRSAENWEEGQETGPGGRGDGANGTEGAVEAATTAPAAAAKNDLAAPAAAAAPSEKEAAAPAAPAAPGKRKDPVDKHGDTICVGDVVKIYSKKKKDLYDNKRANVFRVNSKVVRVQLMEGPGKGDFKSTPFDMVEIVDPANPPKKPRVDAPEPAKEDEQEEVLEPVLGAEPKQNAKLTPDDDSMRLFGDLGIFNED